MCDQDEWIVESIEENDLSTDICDADVPTAENKNTIGKKKHKKSKSEILVQRSEASLNISEFNLTEVGKEKIKLNELVNTSLKTTAAVTHKNLQSVKKLKKLSAPLSKQRQEKIKRAIAYEKVCDEVVKWDSLVQSNRTADQLVFPLKKPDFQLQSMESVAESFVTKHPVEIAVSELLEKSENRIEPKKLLTAAEEKALKAMSAAEAKERHNELMKHRALISYQEAKARHQNKIKSKRYHRLLKREKLKKVVKEFENLQKNDAAKALEKLAELDKLRILERMTLKHRNSGKWAKQQKIRAKYNPDIRSVLKEDLAVGQQLREKVEMPESIRKNIYSLMKSNEIDDDVGLIEQTYGENENQFSMEVNPPSKDSEESFSNKMPKETNCSENVKAGKPTAKFTIPRKDTVDDIMEFVSKEQCLESAIPDGFSLGDEDFNEVMNDAIPMSEAFGDEAYIAEFRTEKEAHEKANKPEGIDLFLPGWGTWGGPGIQQSKRKMKRFFIKPPAPRKKKNTLGNVILNEEEDKKASLHQVSSLPFPFSNVKQFESYIRQPVGHTWNPQSSFQNLVAPKVITKMGKIIEPIDAEDLVLKSKKVSHKNVRRKKNTEAVKAF